MEITGNCPNCNKPNLIDRSWRNDIFCGWCGSEYKAYRDLDGELIIILTKNNHLAKRDKKKCAKEYQKDHILRRALKETKAAQRLVKA